MGRTVLAFSQVIHQVREEWGKFRRALRREDQEALDEIFNGAKYNAQAGAYASHHSPLETIFMAVLLEHQKAIKTLRDRIRELEERIAKG